MKEKKEGSGYGETGSMYTMYLCSKVLVQQSTVQNEYYTMKKFRIIKEKPKVLKRREAFFKGILMWGGGGACL